jgi:hypothetical protein
MIHIILYHELTVLLLFIPLLLLLILLFFSSISLSLLLNPYTIGMLRLLSLSKMKNLSHQKISPLIAITGK